MEKGKLKEIINAWKYKDPQNPKTIDYLSKFMGVTKQSIYSWLNGRFPTKNVKKLCNELGISIEELHQIYNKPMILRFDKEGKLLEKYSSITEAGRAVKGSGVTVRLALNG